MIQNNYGEMIFSESDLADIIMSGVDLQAMRELKVDRSVDIETLVRHVENLPKLIEISESNVDVNTFDQNCQANWLMPEEYKNFDIAAHVLGLCETDAELQRVGEELLLYQERGLFNLLRYLKYLVDTMTENKVIWGVGRGSSVASFVLYKLGVHKINSMFYKLDIGEFLR